MKYYIAKICTILVIAGIIAYLSSIINSTALFTYLSSNILTILLGFLALNTATLGHLAAKIQDVLMKYPTMNFQDVIREMKTSLLEQIILIGLSLSLLILDKSNIEIPQKEFVVNVIYLSIFLFAVDILWDTGKSVFIIIEQIQNIEKK